jgi:hypothetical protein
MTIAAVVAIKGEPFTQNRLSSISPPFLFFLQLALATLPLAHLFHLFRSSPSKLSSIFVHDVEKKLGSRPEEELKPSCHP